MIENAAGHYPFWFVLLLVVIGLYGMLAKKNLVKKLIGMTIFQTAIILFFVVGAFKWDATIPIDVGREGAGSEIEYINPLPHTLMLTAIVVGVATVGVALALLIRIHQQYGSLDEPEVLERMK